MRGDSPPFAVRPPFPNRRSHERLVWLPIGPSVPVRRPPEAVCCRMADHLIGRAGSPTTRYRSSRSGSGSALLQDARGRNWKVGGFLPTWNGHSACLWRPTLPGLLKCRVVLLVFGPH